MTYLNDIMSNCRCWEVLQSYPVTNMSYCVNATSSHIEIVVVRDLDQVMK